MADFSPVKVKKDSRFPGEHRCLKMVMEEKER